MGLVPKDNLRSSVTPHKECSAREGIPVSPANLITTSPRPGKSKKQSREDAESLTPDARGPVVQPRLGAGRPASLCKPEVDGDLKLLSPSYILLQLCPVCAAGNIGNMTGQGMPYTCLCVCMHMCVLAHVYF